MIYLKHKLHCNLQEEKNLKSNNTKYLIPKQGQHRGRPKQQENTIQEIIRGGNVNVTKIFVININIDILENYKNKDVKFEKVGQYI